MSLFIGVVSNLSSWRLKLTNVNASGPNVVVDVLRKPLKIIIWVICVLECIPEAEILLVLVVNLSLCHLFPLLLDTGEILLLLLQLDNFLVFFLHLDCFLLDLVVL